jgi:hypothetical protein
VPDTRPLAAGLTDRLGSSGAAESWTVDSTSPRLTVSVPDRTPRHADATGLSGPLQGVSNIVSVVADPQRWRDATAPQGIGMQSVSALVAPALTSTDCDIGVCPTETVYLPGARLTN